MWGGVGWAGEMGKGGGKGVGVVLGAGGWGTNHPTQKPKTKGNNHQIKSNCPRYKV